MQEAAKGTGEVSSNMDGISKAAAETGAASGQVLSSTQELSQQATRMSHEINKFLQTVRAARSGSLATPRTGSAAERLKGEVEKFPDNVGVASLPNLP